MWHNQARYLLTLAISLGCGSALAQLESQLIPIGSAALVANRATVTHAWYIEKSTGRVIVCMALADLKNGCVAVTRGGIQTPTVGDRYRGLGVSSLVAINTTMTQAWYIDELTELVYVCSALADLQNSGCVLASRPPKWDGTK